MKCFSVVLILFIITDQFFSQNKKEQIEQLTFSKDSLQLILDKERAISKTQIKELEVSIEIKNKEIISLEQSLIVNENELLNSEADLEIQNKEIDSLKKLLTIKIKEIDSLSQLLQPKLTLPFEIFGVWCADEETCVIDAGWCRWISDYGWSGNEWGEEFLEIKKIGNYYLVDSYFAGYGHEDTDQENYYSYINHNVFLYENNILYIGVGLENYNNLPSKSELDPHYKCPNIKYPFE